jgi:hypothetical protein
VGGGGGHEGGVKVYCESTGTFVIVGNFTGTHDSSGGNTQAAGVPQLNTLG